MDDRAAGLMIIGLGVTAVIIGALLAFGGGSHGSLSWFGRLPGDLRFRGEHTRVYIPITSMIVVTVVLNVLLWLFRRL